MKNSLTLLLVFFLISCTSDPKNEVVIDGLKAPVEIIRDEWGLNHIYAENQHDLFFAQGYAAAQDRLFQFEIWRRQATGTVAEILGEKELKRDIGTRLFKFRGNMEDEMNHYHDDGEEIITAYTAGVNAYIEEALQNKGLLPIEFKILGILPQKWTPDVVISRHQGLLGNIGKELQVGRAVAKVGDTKVKELYWFHPQDPDLTLDAKINKELLFDNKILELYNAYRSTVKFEKEDVVEAYRNSTEEKALTSIFDGKNDSLSIGSNNWVVSGAKTADGNTYMANDPHRTIAVPSLRYMVHLVAPGWNVIGGGEPEIPGISIGHNEYGAWGLTVFETDGEDLYVYELNPDNANQYKYNGEWADMNTISETIKVKGMEDQTIDMKYTQHGPVTYVDEKNNVAYAIRCAWLEPGGSPYLASLRMDQAKTWEEFREACSFSHIPGENMIWADKKGNIGLQAVGIAPIRNNFSGMVPVPGDGRYEWDSYLPIIEKPNDLNPADGFIATANQNVTPEDYTHWNAVGYTWADPFRGDRVAEVLKSGNDFDMESLRALQVDYLSIPARTLTPMLMNLRLEGKANEIRNRLKNWDYRLEANSIESAIYVAFENQLSRLATQKFIPSELRGIVYSLQLTRIIQWLENPDERFGANPTKERDQFLAEAFNNGIAYLERTLDDDINKWQYGQEKLKHTAMSHALGDLVEPDLQSKINLGPLPRGGNSYTVGSTGGNNRQSSGASFRMIVNTGDWDAAIATNGPGQSGNPESPFYSNLFEPWAKDQYFPVYYSKEKINEVAVEKRVLKPIK
ncbi:penicillin acylase family protein [Roseivirga sp.]|uniref:penicillin acylase family protein n=1 Tax=Roseivirga sp. TaxID=1964215 RepID=UPI002B26AC19|nr:penicillin acylase family protein [Roseivirga sp.]